MPRGAGKGSCARSAGLLAVRRGCGCGASSAPQALHTAGLSPQTRGLQRRPPAAPRLLCAAGACSGPPLPRHALWPGAHPGSLASRCPLSTFTLLSVGRHLLFRKASVWLLPPFLYQVSFFSLILLNHLAEWAPVQRVFLCDRAEREPLSKESVFLPLRLRLRGDRGGPLPLRSSDVHRGAELLTCAAELSGPTGPFLGRCLGWGWQGLSPAWLHLFVERFCCWGGKGGTGYSCFTPWSCLSKKESFHPLLPPHLSKQYA